MLERDKSDDTRRGASLLALGESQRDPVGPQPSRLMQAIAEVRAEHDAIARHRLARSRRDAHESPLISALAQQRRHARPSPEEADEPVSAAETAEPAEQAAAEPAVPPPAAAPVAAADRRRTEPVPPPERRAIPYPDRPVADDRAAADPTIWKPLIDPGKVIEGVWKSRNLIIATTILGAMLGVAVAISTPKKYASYTELLADPRDLNLVERELTQSGLSTEATLAIVENQVRILQSQTVLSQVVGKLKLDEDPEFNGTAPATGLRGLIDSVKSLVSRADESEDRGRRYAVTMENLAESLSVERGGKTFVIVIGATTLDGEKSALIANTMTEVFLSAYGQLQSDAAGRAADELTSKLDELRASVEDAERKVEQFKAENDIINPQGRLITDDEIVKLNEQLSVARARTLELNARAGTMRSVNVDDVLGGVLPEELASPTIQELRAQYSSLKSEADRLDVRLGPRHPQRQAVEAQLAGSRDLIRAELTRIVSSAQTELKRAVELEQEMSSRLAQLKVRQGSLSNEMVTLRELERDATAKRAVYESFLLRARETGEQSGINSANMSVISKAAPPLHAEGPSRSTIALGSTMLGFLAGLGLGIARGAWESLRETTGRPRLASALRRRRFGHDEDAPATGVPGDDPAAEAAPSQSAAETAPSGDATMSGPNHASYQAYLDAQARAAYPAAYPQHPAYPAAYAPPMAMPVPPQPMPAYPPSYAPHPMAPPLAQPAPYWPQAQMQPPPAYPYPQQSYPQQHAAPPPAYSQHPGYAPPPPFYPQQPAPAAYAAEQRPQPQPAADPSPIEEIRASLRECRDAIRGLAESRGRRRYF